MLYCFENLSFPDFMNKEAKANQVSVTCVKSQGDSMTPCRSMINEVLV